MENDWIFTCKIEPEEEESVVAVTDECEDIKDFLSVEDPEDICTDNTVTKELHNTTSRVGTSTNECVGCRKSLDLVKFIHSQRPEEVFLLLKCVDIFLANSNDDSECARCAEVLMLTKKIVEQRAYDVELSKCANDVETFIECCQSNLLKTELQENPFSDDDEPSVAEFNCLTYEDADLQEPIDSPATISALADPLELDTVNPSHTRKRKVDRIRVKSQDEMGPFPKYCQSAVKQPQIEAGGQLLLAGGAGPFSAWTVVGTLGTNHTVALTAARLCPTSETSDLRGPCSFIANQTDDRTFDAAKLYPSSESSEGCREDSSSCEVAGAPESADPTGKPMNYLPVIEVPGRTKSSTLYHCVMDSGDYYYIRVGGKHWSSGRDSHENCSSVSVRCYNKNCHGRARVYFPELMARESRGHAEMCASFCASLKEDLRAAELAENLFRENPSISTREAMKQVMASFPSKGSDRNFIDKVRRRMKETRSSGNGQRTEKGDEMREQEDSSSKIPEEDGNISVQQTSCGKERICSDD